MTGLRVACLHLAWGPDPAIQGLDLDAPPGSFIAVTGPSGAGKTSLLWALAGAVKPTHGEVTLDGQPLRDREDAAARGVALIPQGNALVSGLTALENVLVPLLCGDQRRGRGARIPLEKLGLMGLLDHADHLVEELSGGQQQRVAVARALASVPSLLLADEPTSDLDPANRERVLQAMRAETQRGAVVVMTTNDPDAAEAADRQLVLQPGEPPDWR